MALWHGDLWRPTAHCDTVCSPRETGERKKNVYLPKKNFTRELKIRTPPLKGGVEIEQFFTFFWDSEFRGASILFDVALIFVRRSRFRNSMLGDTKKAQIFFRLRRALHPFYPSKLLKKLKKSPAARFTLILHLQIAQKAQKNSPAARFCSCGAYFCCLWACGPVSSQWTQIPKICGIHFCRWDQILKSP